MSAPSLARRFKTIFVVGGVPAGVVVSVGDFFSPAGGWMLSLGAGVLAILVLAVMLVRSELRERVRTVAEQSEETQGLFEGPLLKQTGLWCLLVFGVAGLAVGIKSHASAAGGGLLAGSSTSVADAQAKMLGLMQDSVEVQRRSADSLDDISRTGKKETSANPRKELANRGVPWSSGRMADAIRDRDPETLQLFVEGGMSLPRQSLQLALYAFDEKTAAVLTSHPAVVSRDDCITMTRYDQGRVDAPAKLSLVRAVCNQGPARDAVGKRLAAAEERVRTEEGANATIDADRAACLLRLKRDWPVGRLARVPLPGDINGNRTVGDLPEEYAASDFGRYLFTSPPDTTRAQLEAAYQHAVTGACERSFLRRKVDTGERDFLRTVLADS